MKTTTSLHILRFLCLQLLVQLLVASSLEQANSKPIAGTFQTESIARDVDIDTATTTSRRTIVVERRGGGRSAGGGSRGYHGGGGRRGYHGGGGRGNIIPMVGGAGHHRSGVDRVTTRYCLPLALGFALLATIASLFKI